jgi:hypothetical protein
MRLSTTTMMVLVLGLAAGTAGCRLLAGKPEPVGISDVKAVGAGQREWDDGNGGVWRYYAEDKLTWAGAQAICDAMASSTGRRWRMPSPAELLDVRDGGISTAGNAAFGWVSLGPVWAAEWDTAVTDDAVTGVYIDMADGSKHRAVYDDLHYTALCVRTDAAGTLWKEPSLKEGEGSVVVRRWYYVPRRMEFETATVTCAALAEKRHEPWRLPRIDEVRKAVAAGLQGPQNKAFGRDYLTFVWTSEVAAILGSEQAFAVDVRSGASLVADIDEELKLLCVADGAYEKGAKTKKKAKPAGK